MWDTYKPMESWILSVVAAAFYVAGGVFMKYAEGLTRPLPSAAVFALFFGGAAVQTVLMRREELGVGYVVVLGMEALLAWGIGVALFKEPVSGLRIAAVLLVVSGIALLKR